MTYRSFKVKYDTALNRKKLFRRFKPLLLAGLVAILPVPGATACSSGNTTADANASKGANTSIGNDRAKKVILHTVSTMDMVDKRVYSADLEASSEVTLYPLVAERIVSFPVSEGDRVHAGQVVARIRAASIKKSIAQMQAEIESLDQTIGSQKRELERSAALYDKAVITQQTLDQMQSGYNATLAKRKSLEASLGQIEVSAGNAVLKSPVDGFIVGKRLEEGDIAQPAMPLCKIVSVDPIRIELGITEKDLMAVQEGMDVELKVSALPQSVFPGKIIRMLPTVDKATRTNEARIEIANPVITAANGSHGGHLLKPGMYGRVEIVVARRPACVAVPSRALMVGTYVSDNERQVFVVDKNGSAHEKVVQIGVQNGDMVEVTKGLVAGDRVVIRGQYSLRSGDRVTVLKQTIEETGR
ncbi:MAG: efflux RND transporter periplasmic adaptor subunit [Deltaproteobacteria bacterium]|nr:efflux RND transporter periplasmic adaptor subunit [Deltaproteobacteria bacterium]